MKGQILHIVDLSMHQSQELIRYDIQYHYISASGSTLNDKYVGWT